MDDFKILVVEDEPGISSIIEKYLVKEGFSVAIATDGEKALDIFNKDTVHLVILDLMLPKLSGEEVCATIRAKSDLPIIVLTAKTSEHYKIEGLSTGADDYIIKPFNPQELVSRVKALLRRSYKNFGPLAERLVFNDGDLEIDLGKMLVRKKGETIHLTTNEFKIFSSLLSRPGQVFTREQLIELAFGHNYDGYDRTVDTHIKNIRRKIEDDTKKPQYIITVYGIGYKFNPPVYPQ